MKTCVWGKYILLYKNIQKNETNKNKPKNKQIIAMDGFTQRKWILFNNLAFGNLNNWIEQ